MWYLIIFLGTYYSWPSLRMCQTNLVAVSNIGLELHWIEIWLCKSIFSLLIIVLNAWWHGLIDAKSFKSTQFWLIWNYFSVPSKGPTDVAINVVNSTAIEVNYKSPAQIYWNGELIYSRVIYFWYFTSSLYFISL